MPIDLDKPISSKLDIPENDVEPVSDFGENELAFSDIAANGADENSSENNANFPPIKPTKRGISLKKRVKAAQMPAVRAENHGEQPAEEEAVKKVNLGKRKKATQMPAIRADSSQHPVVPWKSGPASVSRAIPPQKLNCGKGMINFAFSDEQNIIRLIFAGIVTAVLTGLFYRMMMFLDKNGGHETAITVVVFAIICFGIGFRVVRLGERWNYEATGREIIFSRKGRASYIIFYKEVLSISYVPYKFLNLFNSGYTVTIIANGERIELNYVFPVPERELAFEDTPFEIIVNHTNQLGLDETD